MKALDSRFYAKLMQLEIGLLVLIYLNFYLSFAAQVLDRVDKNKLLLFKS